MRAAVFTCVLFMLVAVSCSSPSSTQQERSHENDSSVGIGETGVLHSNSGGIPICSSKESFKQLYKSISAHDDYGIQDLVLSGAVSIVPTGTKIRVLDLTLFSTQVRILDGTAQGEAVWVASEYVRGE